MSPTFFLVPLILLGVFFAIAMMRSATVRSVPLTHRVIEFKTAMSPDKVYSLIENGVGEFLRADADAELGAVLLTTKPTLGTWGFYYPVLIQPDPAGGSHVRIGISSRLIQFGPLVTKWHRKCVDSVEGLVGGALPEARVV